MQNEFKPGDIVQFKNPLYHSLHGRFCEVIHVYHSDEASLEGYGIRFLDAPKPSVDRMYARPSELFSRASLMQEVP